MNKSEAVAWAVDFIAYELKHLYYPKEADANEAAAVMTTLSKSRWVVKLYGDRYKVEQK